MSSFPHVINIKNMNEMLYILLLCVVDLQNPVFASCLRRISGCSPRATTAPAWQVTGLKSSGLFLHLFIH